MLGLKRWLGLMVQGLLAKCSGCNPSLSELSLVLSGVLLLPCSFISSMISEESRGELALASSRSCSCWARY